MDSITKHMANSENSFTYSDCKCKHIEGYLVLCKLCVMWNYMDLFPVQLGSTLDTAQHNDPKYQEYVEKFLRGQNG